MLSPDSKVHRDFSAPEPQSAQSEPAGRAVERCRAWLDWAATQVSICLTNDSAACDQLLAALDQMLRAAQRGSAPAMDAAAEPPGNDTIEQKMSAVVIAVQSHDRLMQQLTHVAEALRGLHAHLGDAPRAELSESWQMLGKQQLRAFSMPEERALFARMVGIDGDIGSEHDAASASPVAVELFSTDLDHDEPSI
jgi:hypothetical protein